MSILQEVKRRWEALAVIGVVVAAGWIGNGYMSTTYASKEEFLVAKGTTDLLMDARIESLIKQRDDIKRKPRKDAQDIRDLDYLEKQIDYLRKVQRGQIK